MKSLHRRIVFFGLLAAFLLQAILSMRLTSVTYDETAHLPAGYAYWKTLKIHLNVEHPPLVKLLCAAPLLLLNPTIDLNAPDYSGPDENEWTFGERFLASNDVERIMFWARLPVVMLGLLLGCYVYKWAKNRFGDAAGLAALFLYVTSPNILAHTRLVTTDVGMACFITMTLYHWWRYLNDRTLKRHLLMTGISFGMAMATKYLVIIFIPLLFLYMLISISKGARSLNKRRQIDLLNDGTFDAILVYGMAALVVWATYFFPLTSNFYTYGMSYIQVTRFSMFEYYLLGHFKPAGWASYFLIGFLLKSQAPFLLLLVLSALLWKKITPTWRDDLYLLLPVLLVFAVISPRAANIGSRYVLTVYPFLFVFVSRFTTLFLGRRTLRFIGCLLILWQSASVLRAYPDYLGYYNEFVGGPARAPYLMNDSNTDWGQGLILLRNYMEEQNLKTVQLKFSGNIPPEIYGINHEPVSDADWNKVPSERVYAISTNHLVAGVLQAKKKGHRSDWLYRYEPSAKLGTSIWIYDFREQHL